MDSVILAGSMLFLSTLSLRRATICGSDVAGAVEISIHALLAESDVAVVSPISRKMYFYPRSPCGERLGLCLKISVGRDFYPRSPCGERQKYAACNCTACGISIHALLAESDSATATIPPLWKNFYPRSPCGERQNLTRGRVQLQRISIHALLAESDRKRLRGG